MGKESQYRDEEGSVAKRSWAEFFGLADEIKVPDDFLCDRSDPPPQTRELFVDWEKVFF